MRNLSQQRVEFRRFFLRSESFHWCNRSRSTKPSSTCSGQRRRGCWDFLFCFRLFNKSKVNTRFTINSIELLCYSHKLIFSTAGMPSNVRDLIFSIWLYASHKTRNLIRPLKFSLLISLTEQFNAVKPIRFGNFSSKFMGKYSRFVLLKA